jgi:hypothetical protein
VPIEIPLDFSNNVVRTKSAGLSGEDVKEVLNVSLKVSFYIKS